MNVGWRTDNPPEEQKEYLVQYKDGCGMAVCRWTKRGRFLSDEWYWVTDPYCKVEAWMELPMPYDNTVDRITDFLEESSEEELPLDTYKKLWAIIKGEG